MAAIHIPLSKTQEHWAAETVQYGLEIHVSQLLCYHRQISVGCTQKGKYLYCVLKEFKNCENENYVVTAQLLPRM